MPWVAFSADFDWYPPERNGRWMCAYKAGSILLVTTPCARAARAACKATPARRPGKESGHGEDRQAQRVAAQAGGAAG